MRLVRCAAALAAALALPALAAHAQETPSEALGDVPAGPATLEGRVVHAERPEAAAGVEVVLYALDRSGTPGTRAAETGPDGSFRFEGIANEPGVVYLVGARHADVAFPGQRVIFSAGETLRRVTVEISDPTPDADALRVVRSELQIDWAGARLAVRERHALHNDGARAIFVPEARRGAPEAAPFHTRLFAGAEAFNMPLGLVPEGVVQDGDVFAFYGPIYPGPQEITFAYALPAEPGARSLALRLPDGAETLRVLAPADGPVVDVAGLAEGEPVEQQGLRQRVFEARDVARGFATSLSLDVPERRTDPGALRLADARLILELDDVALSAHEMHRLVVEGEQPLAAAGDDVLLEIPLPPDAQDVKMSGDTLALGLARLDDGTLGVRGPLPPGETVAQISYRIPSGPDGVTVARSFGRRLPLLSIFVADTGVVIDSDRLHRRRPIRDADRTYLALEAFEIEEGETVSFRATPIPPRRGSGRMALAGALLLAVGTLAFLLAPLRDASRADQRLEDAEEESRERRDREAVYAAIHDLDHDYETGKVLEEDYRTLRGELRTQAVALLEAERASAPAAEGPAPAAEPGLAAPACPACRAAVGAEDRFCSQCGKSLEPVAADADR